MVSTTTSQIIIKVTANGQHCNRPFAYHTSNTVLTGVGGIYNGKRI